MPVAVREWGWSHRAGNAGVVWTNPNMEQLRGTPPGTPGEAGGGVQCSLQAETPVLLGQPQDALGQVISHWLVHCEEDLRAAKLVKSALKSKRKRALRKGEELPPALDQDLEDYRERAAKLVAFQKLATEKLAVLRKWPKGRPFPNQFVSEQGSRAPPLTVCPRQDILRLPAKGLGNRWQLLRRADSFLCADHDVSTDGRRDGAPDSQYWQPWASNDSLGHQEMRAGSAIETPGQDQGTGISPQAGRHGVVPSPDESASLTGPGIEQLMKEVQEPATKGAAGGINWTCMGTTTGVTIKKHDHLDVEVSEDMEDGEVADDLVPGVLEEDEGSEAEEGELVIDEAAAPGPTVIQARPEPSGKEVSGHDQWGEPMKYDQLAGVVEAKMRQQFTPGANVLVEEENSGEGRGKGPASGSIAECKVVPSRLLPVPCAAFWHCVVCNKHVASRGCLVEHGASRATLGQCCFWTFPNLERYNACAGMPASIAPEQRALPDGTIWGILRFVDKSISRVSGAWFVPLYGTVKEVEHLIVDVHGRVVLTVGQGAKISKMPQPGSILSLPCPAIFLLTPLRCDSHLQIKVGSGGAVDTTPLRGFGAFLNSQGETVGAVKCSDSRYIMMVFPPCEFTEKLVRNIQISCPSTKNILERALMPPHGGAAYPTIWNGKNEYVVLIVMGPKLPGAEYAGKDATN